LAITKEQQELRRNRIGASDVAALLGLIPDWKTPLDLYLEKTGRIEPDISSNERALWWGNEIEGSVLKRFSHETGIQFEAFPDTLTNAELRGILVGHPDARRAEEPVLVEIKSTVYNEKEWGEPGTNQIPEWVEVQPQTLFTMLPEEWVLSDVLKFNFKDREVLGYYSRRDLELGEMIAEAVAKFWKDNIQADVPPPPLTSEDVRTLFPESTGTIEANEEMVHFWNDYRELKAKEKEAADGIKYLKAKIEVFMGENAILVDPAGTVLFTFKTIHTSKFSQSEFKTAHPELFEGFKRPGSYRSLLPKKPKTGGKK